MSYILYNCTTTFYSITALRTEVSSHILLFYSWLIWDLQKDKCTSISSSFLSLYSLISFSALSLLVQGMFTKMFPLPLFLFLPPPACMVLLILKLTYIQEIRLNLISKCYKKRQKSCACAAVLPIPKFKMDHFLLPCLKHC